MKLFFFLLFGMLFSFTCKADLHYIPLKVELELVSKNVHEGDLLHFVVTLTNTDKENDYPVVMPGNVNHGNKLFYFRVYDTNEQHYIERAMEEREYHIIVQGDGKERVIQLKPGHSVLFDAYCNAGRMERMTAQHNHVFGKPLFAGSYNFQGFYNPEGTIAGDTIYRFDSGFMEEDLSDPRPILYSGGILTQPCRVDVLPTEKDTMYFENKMYTRGRGGWYLNDSIHVGSVSISESGFRTMEFSTNYMNGDPGSMRVHINWYPNGNLQQYSVYEFDQCPMRQEYMAFTADGGILMSIEHLSDGSCLQKQFNEAGDLLNTWLYAPDGSWVDHVEFNPKNGKAKRPVRTYKPCQVELQELKIR